MSFQQNGKQSLARAVLTGQTGGRSLILPLALLVFGVMAGVGPADAMRFKLGEDTTIDFDTTLSYAAAWRTTDRDLGSVAITNPNGDDGDWNFEKGSMINNRFGIIADIDVKYKSIGAFVRPRAYYDFVYMSENSNPGLDRHPTNNNFLAGTISEPDEFDSGVKEVLGYKAELLDYFAYGNFVLAGRFLDLRVGQQVVAWGEQLYIPGGVASAMSHVDLTAANVPGIELKEVYLPSESVSVRMDLFSALSVGVSVAGFYQWEWEPHRLNEAGSYFSDNDFIDEAGHGLITPLGVVPRGNDEDARDEGQYGVSMLFRFSKLFESELGFYYINYHEKAPMVRIAPGFSSYYLTYAEDVKLYGVSFSSWLWGVSISGEFTYRHDFPLMIGTGVYEKGDMIQAQFAWMYVLGENPTFFDDVNFFGEVGWNGVQGKDGADMVPDDGSWGFTVTLTPKIYQVLPDVDLDIPLVYKANPSGTSPNATFKKGADSASYGLSFIYKSIYKLDVKYVQHFNAARNTLFDRDFVGINLKYTF